MTRFYLLAIAIAACDPVSQVGAQADGNTRSGDAPNNTPACGTGVDAFNYTSAGSVVAFTAYDFNFVTSNAKVVGVAGSATNADILAFNTQPLMELETLGDHDISAEYITALRAPFNVSCDTGNTMCHGFYAHAGTYTVLAVHPRYQATFTLSNLFERTDNSGPPGGAIAGSISGCIDKDHP